MLIYRQLLQKDLIFNIRLDIVYFPNMDTFFVVNIIYILKIAQILFFK